VLFELEGWLRLKIPPLPAPVFADGLARAGADLLRHGICAFHDASAGNTPADVDLFRRLRAETVLRSRPTVMVGIDAFSEVVDAGLTPFCEAGGVRLGHVKIMVHETAEGVHPSPTTLAEDVWRVHRSGFHVAIHAVEEAAVCAAVDALEKAQRRLPRPDARHRIEHCALCPPPFVDWLAATRCGVVLQPGFLHAFGDKYAAEINSDVHGWLYRLRSLKRAGIAIAGSSDCPVGPLSPLVGIGAAMTRRSSSGVALNLDEALTLREALGLYTHAAAWMGFEDNRSGRLLPGRRADLVVVNADLTGLPASEVGSCVVGVCVIDGQIVWEA
jgi:predicted amidohydrolase YtcJ